MSIDRRALNVGCGDYPLKGHVNFDLRDVAAANLQGEALEMPFLDASFDEIYAGHVLEHFSADQAIILLSEWRRIMADDGRLTVVVPNAREAMLRYVSRATDVVIIDDGERRQLRDIETLNDVLIYNNVTGEPHRRCYDRELLTQTLTQARFRIIGEVDPFQEARISDPIMEQRWLNLGMVAVKGAQNG